MDKHTLTEGEAKGLVRLIEIATVATVTTLEISRIETEVRERRASRYHTGGRVVVVERGSIGARRVGGLDEDGVMG